MPPLLQQLQAVWRELPGLVGDRVELFSLELQRAGLALIQIVVLVVACGILGVTAWLALWFGVIAALVAVGLHLGLVLLLVFALNLGAAWWAMARVRRMLVMLTLPGTRRHLMPGKRPEAEATADLAETYRADAQEFQTRQPAMGESNAR